MNSTEQNLDGQATEYEIFRHDLNGDKKKEFNLRGPREGKKSKNKPVDQKKLSLVKSLFGKKK